MTEDEEVAELEAELDKIERDALPLRRRLGEIARARYLRAIPDAMVGNMVWCRNGAFCHLATPCEQVRCTYKGGDERLATSTELSECDSFQITTPSSTWYSAVHVLPRVER